MPLNLKRDILWMKVAGIGIHRGMIRKLKNIS